MSLLLVRHCSAEGQDPEAALTPSGVEQSTQLAAFLAERRVSRIICSPYRRAVQSAQPLAALLNLPIESDARLIERRVGLVSDGDWRAALRRSFKNSSLCLPEGESSTDAIARVRAVVDSLGDGQRDNVAVFSHGNLLTLLAQYFDNRIGYDFWEALTNPDVIEINRRGPAGVVQKIWA